MDVVGHLSFGDKASRMIATRERQIAPRSGNDLNKLWLNGIITLGKMRGMIKRLHKELGENDAEFDGEDDDPLLRRI